MKASISKNVKKRNWATVCYPESVNADWIEILKMSGVQAAISPLHDRDLEADESTPKKPHWHVLLVYPGPKSYASMKAFCDSFGAVSPIPLESVRGYYRYLTHEDNPEKVQYNKKDIQVLNRFSILDYVEMTRTESLEIKQNLLLLIREQDLIEYSHLLDYLQDEGLMNELDVALSNTIMLNTYLSSRRHAKENKVIPPASLAKEAGNGHD